MHKSSSFGEQSCAPRPALLMRMCSGMPDELICVAKLRTDLHSIAHPRLGIACDSGQKHAANHMRTTLPLDLMSLPSAAHPKSARSILMNSTCASGMSCLNWSIALRARSKAQGRPSPGRSHLGPKMTVRTAGEPAHFLALSGLRPVTITCAPCCSSLCAAQKPMPAVTR